MLQPRESRLSISRRKRRNLWRNLCCYSINSALLIIIIGCVAVLPQGLTQQNDDPYIVKPTPALRLGKEELTTVLLVKNDNDNHGRFINVRPEVGLLTSTARTFIQEGVTTEYATQVVGTTLDNGRVYAQYLKKSSRVLYDGGIVPSVVTSWVGESSKSDGLLPQSHNDLFDADQPDWQAIDDRLLGQRQDFVGNTDYVGIRESALPVSLASQNDESKTLSWSSSSSTSSSNSKPLNFVGRFGVFEEDARKIAANKVLPIGDLPTYTIKQHYEPSAYSDGQTDDEDDDSDDGFGRNPKLIYKQLMLGSAKSENDALNSAQKTVIPATRHLATVTYYGFADFTTVVGDSVIVFSPSTATPNMNLNTHVTSIKGEATLGAGVPQGPSVSTVSITITQDLIEPTFTNQNIDIASTISVPSTTTEAESDADVTINKETTTEIPEIKNAENEGGALDIPSLEMSEVVVRETLTEKSLIQATSVTAAEASVMLSRPSDEEILRIYNALAIAEADKKKLEMTTATSISEKVVETSKVEILGGATTIFFEDDPFANFVEPAKTSSSSSSTLSIASESVDGSTSTVTSLLTTNVESSSTASSVELVTEPELTTTEVPIENETTTISDLEINMELLDTTEPALANVVIKEIDPNDAEVDANCIRTSQVFLTQLPKTITQFATVVVTDDLTSELKTEIRQEIQPTFDIGQATKYYCIQASKTQQDQLEAPSVSVSSLLEDMSRLNENKEAEITTEKQDAEEEEEEEVEKKVVQMEESRNENSEEQKTDVPVVETTESVIELKSEQPDSLESEKPQEVVHSGEGGENEAEDEEDDEDEEISANSDDEDDEEIELIYKTLYTTYTYLTTFFHDESTSISSHTEVVTNVLTSTLGISTTSVPLSTQLIANLNENEINPTMVVSSRMESTSRYVVPSEVETFIRSEEEMHQENQEQISLRSSDVLDTSKATDSLATFYTTYTYYTTIFAEGETEIMSHTEVITNLKKSTPTILNGDETSTTTSLGVSEQPTPVSKKPVSVEESITPTTKEPTELKDIQNVVIEPSRAVDYNTISRSKSLLVSDIDSGPSIPDLGDLSAITLVTDVRSSSSTGNQQIINHLSPKKFTDLKSVNDQMQQSILEDQISSESNTDTDEIIPSATLLLQTSFTTFTYYTTMYSGDKTNVISRLETMTNTVTETLQASKTINLEEASIPITYFTTFTYWTKLAKEGQITTLSREETISNVVTPTMVLTDMQDKATETQIATTTESKLSEDFILSTLKEKVEETAFVQTVDNSETATTAKSSGTADTIFVTSVLEPTTYYTTYTYYTTSYEAENTITDSRFETVTNIITPTTTVTSTIIPDSTTTALKAEEPSLILYDFKKIIDADGVSTLYFTTQIEPTVNSEGLSTEVISSTSSLYINEEKKNSQAAATSVPIIGPDGQIQKQYKTGLVRLIEGTRIGNRTTTLYQSKVIGTVIDQRYAQIIESTSSFIFEKTQAPEIINMDSIISPTSASPNENIQSTQQATLAGNSLPNIEGSIKDQDQEQETSTEPDTDTEAEEDENTKTDEKLRFPFQTKKRPFVPPLKSFPNRSRPQFAPKKNSSATIITRSDFTPTITATPALKTVSRFSSTRRGSGSASASNPSSLASSSRRFGRPNKSSIASGSQVSSSAVSSGFSSSSRNRFAFGSASSSAARPSFSSSSRRSGGATIRPSFSRPALFSTGFPGNSRNRVKPTATVDSGDSSVSLENSTSPPANSQEDEDNSLGQEEQNEDENATESTRRQNNPLLRLRRPLNRPQGFTPARPQSNSPNNAVSPRRNPLTNRARNSNAATTTTTTTTTQRPKPRTFQRPVISNNAQSRARPANSLFPPRNIFGAQKTALTTEENKDLAQSEEDNNENDNDEDSEYEDDDDEEADGDEDDETNRRRRSNVKTLSATKKLVKLKSKSRSKREADTSQQTRSNFRSRFRRPKLVSSQQSESKNYDDDAAESSEAAPAVAQTTPTLRTRSRFGARYPAHSGTTSTTSSTSTGATNHRAIRPTRPSSTNGARAQFTLREKDSSTTTTTQKGLTSAKRPAFRRPQPAGGSSTRRLPSSTASSTSAGKRRLKSFTSNDASSSSSHSRNSVTSRSRPSTPSGRSRSGSSRDSGVRGRGRGNHDYNNDPLIADYGGTITVTHVVPAEVTIPVVNGKVTEYKQVVTAKTSTEVVGPQQYTTTLGSNGQSQLALTREDTSVNYNGATEVTQYVLHETPTTTITFTPTTIRGRKTSFSHVLPSTVYSVEQVVSTIQPQISANAPLANILLSQLLLGNVGLNNNPLLGALGGALTQQAVGLGTSAGPPQPATPVTEYKTHASTYVTTVVEGQSTILPITFQGKKILTTIFDTTAQTITATEFITDTIVTTPTVMQQAQPVVNSLLLQQLLLQQHLQQQQIQQPSDPTNPLNAILNSVPPQLLLGGDSLQELEVSNNIRGSGQGDLIPEDDDFATGGTLDLDDIALQAQAQTHKSGRKKSRKNGKNHKRKHNAESSAAESSVITLYVSGRRPGEFSTVLSTVQVRPDSTLYKRQAHTIDSYSDYYNSEGSELINEYLAVPEIILLDDNLNSKKTDSETTYENDATESLESIVGDVTTHEIHHPQFYHFDSGQEMANHEIFKLATPTLKSSYDSEVFGGDDPQSDIDEARYNLATRIMSNGVEVIIASDKTKTIDHVLHAMSPSHQLSHNNNKPMTLAASTIKNQMMILLLPSSSSADRMTENQTQQFTISLPFPTNHFITKTCLTTYTYRTTYVQDGQTTVESREKVVSNIATEERNYPKITPSQTMGVTLTRTPELAVGIFPTTYLYFNTFKDNSNNLQVMTSDHTVINTITGPDDYIAYLQPTAKATPVLETNTYYNKVTLSQTRKPPAKDQESVGSKVHMVEKILTQVIVTKSLPPARSTSVLTSYYTFDDVTADGDILKLSTAALDSAEQLEADNVDRTKDLDDIHIYATKKFLTTFTYYTTSILKTLITESQAESAKPMSTIFNYHTRVIENVITDSVPARLLPTELVSKMKLELRKQKHQRRVIVTTATLKGGQTLKITAMKMFKPSIRISTASPSVVGTLKEEIVKATTTLATSTSDKLTKTMQQAAITNINSYNEGNTAHTTEANPQGEVNRPIFVNEDFIEEDSSLENVENEDLKQQEQYTGETDNLDALSSEHVAAFVIAPKNQTLQSKFDLSTTTAKPSAANQLIQRLTALRPMINAMAGLLQNNFGVAVENVKPLKHIESKHAPNKKIMSSASTNSTLETHPIYIPVQKPSPVSSPYSQNQESYSDYMPQSLHIHPPVVSEMTLESNDKENWLMPPAAPQGYNNAPYISLAALNAPRHEQPLHNGGIYIRPGEVITANSDVIVGKPNGIEYVQIPNQFNVDNVTNTPNANNRKYQVTYYQHNIQHPYKTSNLHRPQHIPISGTTENKVSNNILESHQFGLRPPSKAPATEHFNKNILKPPPLPHTSQHMQQLLPSDQYSGSHLPISTKHTLMSPPSSSPKTSPPTSQQQSNAPTAHRIFIHSSMQKLSAPQPPPHKGQHNLYHFNNELKNNEILEIKRIPEVFSTDLKPSPVFTPYFVPANSHFLTQSNIHGQQQNTKNLESNAPKDEKFESLLFSDKKVITDTPQNHQLSFDWEAGPSVNSASLDEVFLKNLSLLKGNLVYSPATNMFYPTSKKPLQHSNAENSQQETLKDMASSEVSNVYSNLHSSKNRQRINLDQNVFSHTVDVNVPPLTFNREDHDYPQQATAIRGQIPSSVPSKTSDQANYMPLIKIPANEQQVQVNLTPLNVIGTIAAPIVLPNQQSYSAGEAYDDNDAHNSVTTQSVNGENIDDSIATQTGKISPQNANLNIFVGIQDQKPVATSNVFVSKPGNELQKSWNHHVRHQLPPHNANSYYENKSHFPVQLTSSTANDGLLQRQGLNVKESVKDAASTGIADQQLLSASKTNGNWIQYPKFTSNKMSANKSQQSTSNQASSIFGLNSHGHHKPVSNEVERRPSPPPFITKPIPHFNVKTNTDWLESHNYDTKEYHNYQPNIQTTPHSHTPNKNRGEWDSLELTKLNESKTEKVYLERLKNDSEITKDENLNSTNQNSSSQNIINSQNQASIQNHNPTNAWRSKQPQSLKERHHIKHQDRIATKTLNVPLERFKEKSTNPATSSTKSTPIIAATAENINEIINTDNDIFAKNSSSESNLQTVAHGQPFSKPLNNLSSQEKYVGNIKNKSAIFVATGEAFKIPNTENPDILRSSPAEQDFQSKEIFITHETQHAKQSSVQSLKSLAKLATTDVPEITLRPLALDIQPPPLVKTASTETVVGLNPPPLPTSTVTTTRKVVAEQSLASNGKKLFEARKRYPFRQQQGTQSQLEFMPPQRPPLQRAENYLPHSKTKYETFERPSPTPTPTPTTTKIASESKKVIATHDLENETLSYQELKDQTTRERYKFSLQPSETYDELSSSTSLAPPRLTILTTTTTTTTTTLNRIVLPTKYITNKHIYTVTTTATTTATPPLQYKLTTSFLPPTSTLKTTTTETTTATATLLVTQTEITTVVDTVTSVKTKTLKPATVTATTTLKPNLTASTTVSSIVNSQLATLSSTKTQTLEKTNNNAGQLPYPSVEIVSTNITKEKAQTVTSPDLAINPEDNSIFIVMTNNKKNSVLKSPSSTQIGNIPLDLEVTNGDMAESNEVMIDYDDSISFDALPTRDEEPTQTVNVKSVSSNGKNGIVDGSSDNHILLGGVLIATPPKSPKKHVIDLNLNETFSCRPECKSTRNEICALVDKHWACICRPGFARMFPDRPCKPTYTYALLMHAERVGNYPLQYVQELRDNTTEHYKQLSQLLHNALDRMIMQSDFRDAYHGVQLTQILDDHKSHQGIMSEFLLQLSDNSDEKRLEDVFKKHLRLSNYSIGGTDLYTNKDGVDALAINDFNECLSRMFHDCSKDARCFNLQGTYTCSCREGFADLSENTIYPGRLCSSEQIGCEQCHYHGKCSSLSSSPTSSTSKTSDRTVCECFPWYTGAKCQVNLKILLIVLLGIGTLLFILLLFCILITCTKRRKHQHTALATSTMTSTSVSGSGGGGGLQKNSRFSTNLLITSVGVGLRGSTDNGCGMSNKRQKSIKIDKRSMIKDSSSETSQNSLPYVLKNRESFAGSCNQSKSPHLSYSQKYSNYRAHINANDQYGATSNNHLGSQNNLPSTFTTVNQQNDSQTANNSAETEGHYCEQSDRSLTVMIPRAKYHSSVLPQTQLMHHQLTMERTYKSTKADHEVMFVDKNSDIKQQKVSLTSSFTGGDVHSQIPTNPGALISAGFEVSAIVSDHTNAISSTEKQHHNLVCLEPTATHTSITTSDPETSVGTNRGQKHVVIDGRQHFRSSKKCQTENFETESEYNIYKCEKDLIETMDEWLGNVKLNELSAEARSFDETTVRASTKPLRICIDETQTQQINDEANTMAERDIGSTFLLPHTHLYKPERQESELSGFDSF